LFTNKKVILESTVESQSLIIPQDPLAVSTLTKGAMYLYDGNYFVYDGTDIKKITFTTVVRPISMLTPLMYGPIPFGGNYVLGVSQYLGTKQLLAINRPSQGEVWQGTTLLNTNGTNSFNLKNQITIEIASSTNTASIPIMIKIEGGNGVSKEYTQNNTFTAGVLYTVTYDITGNYTPNGKYTTISIFCNFLATTVNTMTFYIGDLKFV
jgi:hypothetical protein